MMGVTWGAATDVGSVRRTNEDSLLAEGVVFAVADGVGGRAGGEVASRLAVHELRRLAEVNPIDSDQVIAAIHQANATILDAGRASEDLSGMGTTIVGLALVENRGGPYWFAFNVGDSRLYRVCRQTLTQVTVDHSLVHDLVADGAISESERRDHPQRNVVTRVLGTDPAPAPDCWLLSPVPGERFMLCSDGVFGELGDGEILAILAAEQDPAAAAGELIRRSVLAGGRDNVTAVVVDVASTGAEFDDSTDRRSADTGERELVG